MLMDHLGMLVCAFLKHAVEGLAVRAGLASLEGLKLMKFRCKGKFCDSHVVGTKEDIH